MLNIGKKSFLAALLAALAAVLIISRFVFSLHQPLNSDRAFYGVIANDIIENHNFLMTHWHIPLSTFIFTDLPFYILTLSVSGLTASSVLTAECLIVISCAFALALAVLEGFGATTAGWALIGGLAVFPYASYHLLEDHTATTLFSFLMIWVLQRMIPRASTDEPLTQSAKQSMSHLLLLFLILTATAFSDMYVIVSFVAPVGCALVLQRFLFRKPLYPIRIEIVLYFLLITSLATAHGLHLISGRLGGPEITMLDFWKSSAGELNQTVPTAVMNLIRVLEIGHGAPMLLAIPNAVLCIAAFSAAVMGFRTFRQDTRKLFMTLYCSLFIIGLLVALGTTEYAPVRYLSPILFPFMFFVSLTVSAEVRLSRWARITFITAFIFSSLSTAFIMYQSRPPQPHREIANYLREQGLSYGYSEFWDANIITLLSDSKVKVRAIRYDPDSDAISPFHWISKSTWYHPSEYRGHTFLLLNESTPLLPHEAVLRHFGPPLETMHYGGYSVYLWPFNIMEPLMSVNLRDNEPFLVSRIVQSSTGYAMRAAAGVEGTVVLSDPWSLAPGRYRIVFGTDVSQTAESMPPFGEVEAYEIGANDRFTRISGAEVTLAGPAEYYLMVNVESKKHFTFKASTNGSADFAIRYVYVEKF